MTASNRPQTLELFFANGRPDGMLTASVFNWTGHVLLAPRTQLPDALAREEAHNTGVYLLIGDTDSGSAKAYIGEGEYISYRIRSHDASKDWWTQVAFISSDGNRLNKAHAQYLEARLIEIARQIGKVELENGTNPTRPSLSEADRANMEAFLDYLLMVLPAIRIDCFLESRRTAPSLQPAPKSALEAVARFEMRTIKHGIEGRARLEGGEFIVEAGSVAKSSWRESSNHIYRRLFEELIQTGVLAPIEQDRRVFTTDYAFRSPSAAAAVLNGRASNGQEAWRVPGSSETYREWEARRI